MKKYKVDLQIELHGGISGHSFYTEKTLEIKANSPLESVKKAKKEIGTIGFVVTATTNEIKS